jgi:hypothetical protein
VSNEQNDDSHKSGPSLILSIHSHNERASIVNMIYRPDFVMKCSSLISNPQELALFLSLPLLDLTFLILLHTSHHIADDDDDAELKLWHDFGRHRVCELLRIP